ncbi:hypothetical protein [Clostridium tetani]|uniref:Uncharacterized protein n=1 Tax=Clostridium tetani TaxID=1513 RepID=A0ABC8EHC2_CLOTA|nr:hypothetical protein [Clostridium tetani]BDR82571.1 hypothetical protein K234311028_p20540 [Clostridium tetani]
MRNIFKEAHKMTREIKKEYKKVDYRTQFGLCLSYLLSKKDNKVTWETIANACEEAVDDLGMTNYYVNNWVKGNNDRSYIELRYYRKGKCKSTVKCGYWDNNKNVYVPENKYVRQYNVLKKEYI